MEKLPEELICIVAGFLPKRGLAPYATLSTQWQRAIERRTFSSLRIESTDEDLDTFGRFLTPRRRKYLDKLYFTVVVPFNEASIKPRSEQQTRFSAAFTDALRKLFLVLAALDAKDANTSDASKSGLLLYIYEIRSTLDTWDQPSKYLTRHIRLLGCESFPSVQCVSRLGIRDTDRKIALRTGIELATRLPNLRSIDIETVEQDSGKIASQAAVLRENRHGLAEALSKPGFLSEVGSLGHLRLTTDDLEATDLLFKPRFVFPNCFASTAGAPSYDPLGVAIRTLSQNLTSLNLCGTFDASLFWPTEAETTSSLPPQWPHLKHMTVKLGICTPNGGWHFKAKPGVRARKGSWPPPLNIPCEDEIQAVFASWSKALSHMPVLESSTIWFHVEMTMPPNERAIDKWVVGFHAPSAVPDPVIYTCHKAKVATEDLQNPRLIFERTNGWRPWKTTMAGLHKMAKERFPSKDLVELDVDMLNEVTRT